MVILGVEETAREFRRRKWRRTEPCSVGGSPPAGCSEEFRSLDLDAVKGRNLADRPPFDVVHRGAGCWFVTHEEANHRGRLRSKPRRVNFLRRRRDFVRKKA